MSLRPEIRTRARGDMLRQFRWYCKHATLEVADSFMAEVDAEILRLSARPNVGVRCRFPGMSARFLDYYFVPLSRPYDVFLLFYKIRRDKSSGDASPSRFSRYASAAS